MSKFIPCNLLSQKINKFRNYFSMNIFRLKSSDEPWKPLFDAARNGNCWRFTIIFY